MTPNKILQIGNYPPPMCGWAIQTVLVERELRKRGHTAATLNVNESRKIKGAEFIDVQNGFDFLLKIWKYSFRGYQIHAHLNAESYKLYLLDMAALLTARLFGRPAVMSFHGGLPQKYFPKKRPVYMRWAFQFIFHLAGRLTCDSEPIKQAIVDYGIRPEKILTVPCFSAELLQFNKVQLSAEAERFLADHEPVSLCYVSFRPEYRLPVLREGIKRFRGRYPRAGFILLGFPGKELPAARAYLQEWPVEERESVLLLGNLEHDDFLSLLSRCTMCLRTPACDGVSASVLESLSLGVPVVASENGRRPQGVVTYVEDDADDMCAKLAYVVENYAAVKQGTRLEAPDDNTARTVDWILGESRSQTVEAAVNARG